MMEPKQWGMAAAACVALASSPAQAECANVFGCVCGANDVVVVATVLEVRQDGYMSVEIERIEEIEPGAANSFRVGDVVDALPDMQVMEGARAYLTAVGIGATDLSQFNQAEPDGSVICSDVTFEEAEFLRLATAPDCYDLAKAQGIESRCVDEVNGCSLSEPPPDSPASHLGWLVAALAVAARRVRWVP